MKKYFQFSSRKQTRELEKELSTTKEKLNIEREEVAKFQEKSRSEVKGRNKNY